MFLKLSVIETQYIFKDILTILIIQAFIII